MLNRAVGQSIWSVTICGPIPGILSRYGRKYASATSTASTGQRTYQGWRPNFSRRSRVVSVKLTQALRIGLLRARISTGGGIVGFADAWPGTDAGAGIPAWPGWAG